MRLLRLSLVLSLAAGFAAPVSAVLIDFESLVIGNGLAEINAVTVPLGATFDGANVATPPVIVEDPDNGGGKSIQAGTLPSGADILIALDTSVDTFRIRYPDEPTQADTPVVLIAYNHTDSAASIQGTGGVVGFLQGSEPVSLELNANGMWAVQAELSGSPIVIDDVEFLTVCGNGYWGGDEECDDGGTLAGDGCDATCLWEPAAPGELRNGDFEISEPVGGAIPTTFGDWDTDVSILVSSSGELLPLGGSQMLCFDSTGLLPNAGGIGGDVRQFVDVSHLAQEIEAAEVTATLSAFFNRAFSKGLQDSEFSLALRAHDGSPATFAGGKGALDLESATLLSDADEETWEELTVELVVPPGTTYLEVGLSAIENVFDDPTRPAFEGLCADGVTLEVRVDVPGVCGDGVLNTGEQCDDGNTTDGDGCSALCQDEEVVAICAPAPLSSCNEAAKASLSIVEKKPGNEKWKVTLKGLADATTAASFGDPVSGSTAITTCVYDAEGALVNGVLVDRAGQTCGPKGKPCWKVKGDKGWSYKDPDAGADGARKLTVQSGPDGKGKLQLQAGNKVKKSQAALPTGVAAALQNVAAVRVQVVTSDAGCFDALLGSVKKADGEQVKAKAP